MFLDDIGDYLSSGGVGTVGTTLFKGLMPDSPDAAVALYETGGMFPAHTMNPAAGQAVCERPSLQVVCRATQYAYEAARTKAHDIFKLMDGMPKRTLNGVEYHWAEARHSPRLIGRDPQGRVLVVCNYDVYKAMTP